VEFANKLVLNSGFVFDYTNMLGEGRIKTEDLQEMETAMQKARDAVNEMRSSGTAYNHLSKDGTPEPVYFTRLPEIKNGNPNTPVSLQKLKEFGDYLRTNVDAYFWALAARIWAIRYCLILVPGRAGTLWVKNAAMDIRASIFPATIWTQASAKKL